VRSLLTRPSNLRVHMAADIERLSAHLSDISLVNVWINEFVPTEVTSTAERFVSYSLMRHTMKATQGSHTSWKVLDFFLKFPGHGKFWKMSLVL